MSNDSEKGDYIAPGQTRELEVADEQHWARRLIRSWYGKVKKKPKTLRAYKGDIRHFTAFLGLERPRQAAEVLLQGGRGRANEMVMAYLQKMQEKWIDQDGVEHPPYMPSTITRRLYALRSLIDVARVLDLIDWHLDVTPPQAEKYTDTAGPGKEACIRIYAYYRDRRDVTSLRDNCVLKLMLERGLRREEVVNIDIEDLDLEATNEDGPAPRVKVLRKRKMVKKWMTISPNLGKGIKRWLEARAQMMRQRNETQPRPLFIALDFQSLGQRLTVDGVYYIVTQLSKAIGIKLKPHGLRHAAITAGLDETGGNLREVAQFAGHDKNVNTTMLYDDNRKDFGGKITKIIADSWEQKADQYIQNRGASDPLLQPPAVGQSQAAIRSTLGTGALPAQNVPFYRFTIWSKTGGVDGSDIVEDAKEIVRDLEVVTTNETTIVAICSERAATALHRVYKSWGIEMDHDFPPVQRKENDIKKLIKQKPVVSSTTSAPSGAGLSRPASSPIVQPRKSAPISIPTASTSVEPASPSDNEWEDAWK